MSAWRTSVSEELHGIISGKKKVVFLGFSLSFLIDICSCYLKKKNLNLGCIQICICVASFKFSELYVWLISLAITERHINTRRSFINTDFWNKEKSPCIYFCRGTNSNQLNFSTNTYRVNFYEGQMPIKDMRDNSFILLPDPSIALSRHFRKTMIFLFFFIFLFLWNWGKHTIHDQFIIIICNV